MHIKSSESQFLKPIDALNKIRIIYKLNQSINLNEVEMGVLFCFKNKYYFGCYVNSSPEN